jgi:hypothetical protein
MVFMTLISIAGALITGGEKRVQPTAEPRAPKPAEAVVIRFKTKQTLDGVYRAEARQAGCRTRGSRTRVAPAQGRDVRLRIRAPRGGWCAGMYKATVYFKQNQHCPPTISCGGVAEHAIGSTRFTVAS